MTTLQGHGHCGGVTVSANDRAFGVVARRGDDWQRLHGNFFALLVAPAAKVVWSGEIASPRVSP